MARVLAFLFGGILIGAAASYLLVAPSELARSTPAAVVRDIVSVPTMSESGAQKHREEGYQSLLSIKQIQALPSEFARTEALYVLAGRSDSGSVQNLIYEANRIADPIAREIALNVLFYRLTELDPQSALALARVSEFSGHKSVERRVWTSWARRDLDAALDAIRGESNHPRQKFAAQALYAAYGYMGNETTDRIEAELGIGPDRSSRGRFIYKLADESPAAAIAFINQMRPGSRQEQMVSWLASHLAQTDPERAASYAELFESRNYQASFERVIARNAARSNPREVLDRLLTGDRDGLRDREIYSAMRSVASMDITAAVAYFEQMRPGQERQALSNAIVAAMVRENIDDALAWARSNDTGSTPALEMQVLRAIGKIDTDRALLEAESLPNAQMRGSAISEILQTVAQHDPEKALNMLDSVPRIQQRDDIIAQAVGSWMRRDANGAVDWLLGQDEDKLQVLLKFSQWSLRRGDLNAVMRLAPVIPAEQQQQWRHQLAQRIASERSPADAMNFISQYQSEPGYQNLNSAIIVGVAQTDVFAARQLADQMPDGNDKDETYAQLIKHRAMTHPDEAVAWLDLIRSDDYQGRAAAQVLRQWYPNDPTSATRWVKSMPTGIVRDDAILSLAAHWQEYGPDEKSLIATVSDPDKRGQAIVQHIYAVAQRDPAKAIEMAEDADLPDHMRKRVEEFIVMLRTRM